MVGIEKELTIKEIKQEIKDLEDDIDLYLTLKEINYIKTQPQAVQLKDIVTDKSNRIFDKFTHYTIKDEDYDITLYSKTQSLLAWQQRLVEKMKSISQSDSKAYITYLREEENCSWEKIARITSYSERQARRIYKNE